LKYYIEELTELIKFMDISEGYYLYGSSWGSMIIQEYAVLQPQGLRGIVLDGEH
jgi:L-proline amide hydrolase